MKDRIIINKNLIPYTFEILLGDIWYEIEVNYNETADLFVENYKNAVNSIVNGKGKIKDV